MSNNLSTDQLQLFTKKLVSVSAGMRGAKDLSQDSAKEALEFLFSNESDPVLASAFFTALRFKGANPEELAGFCDAIKEHSLIIHPEVKNLVDCSGPYDGRSKTLSLNVAHALVAAAAGVPIILHSTSGLNPKFGITSADVLEALGVPAYLQPSEVEKRIEENNFGFLHSSRFAYGIEKFRGIREKVHFRTFLHTCETLNNPTNAKNMIFGVAHGHFQQRLLEVVKGQGVEQAIAVSGLEGSDELPLKATKAMELIDGEFRPLELNPEDFGLSLMEKQPAKSAAETAHIISDALTGKNNEHNGLIVYNAGIRIYLGNKAESIDEGIKIAENVLESGAAAKKLEEVTSAKSF